MKNKLFGLLSVMLILSLLTLTLISAQCADACGVPIAAVPCAVPVPVATPVSVPVAVPTPVSVPVAVATPCASPCP
ncbi:Uncharacterised protein [uncultured archaeon]|nr:Uncharacterised protein [uncultured archaeon]